MRATLLALTVLAAPLAWAQTDTTAVAPSEPVPAAPVGPAVGDDALDATVVEEAPAAEPAVAEPAARVDLSAPKEVALGYVLGYLFPGGGHYYAGETSRGAMLTASAVAGYAFVLSAALTAGECGPNDLCTVSRASVTQFLAGFGLLVGTSVYSIVDGGQAVRRTNRARGVAAVPRATVAPQGAGLAMRVRL